MTLNSGWKQWDKYLSVFVGKKINCLDIGAYEGASTCWMLNNLCSNPQSIVYSVDTWKGGPDFSEKENFNTIEKKFDENVKNTGRHSQNVKFKMLSSEALIKLRSSFNYIYFDLIFIDASHEAKDVITDAIISWDLLAENGIMIFDDYEWKKLNKEYFCPKIAIDSFVKIFKPQIEILYVGYQFIIKKKESKLIEKAESDETYKLIRDITYFKFTNINIEYNNDINFDLQYSVVMKKEKPKYINKDFEIITKFNNDCDVYEKYNFFHMLYKNNSFEIIKNTIEKNNNINFEIKKNFNNTEYYYFLKNNSNLYKILKYNNDNNICLFTRYILDQKDIENKIYNIYNKKINVVIYTLDEQTNNNNNYHNIKFKNYEDILNILKIIKNNKYNFLYFRNLIKKNSIRKLKEQRILTNIYIYIIFIIFNIQKIGGSNMITLNVKNTFIYFECILILKKHFKNISLISDFNSRCNIYTVEILCSEFKGISKKELFEFENVVKEISKKNNDYLNYPRDDYLFLHSILKYTPEIKLEIQKIEKLLHDDLIKLTNNNIEYMNLLISIKKNIDENKYTNKKKVAHLENVLYKRQVSEFIYIFNSIVNGIKNK